MDSFSLIIFFLFFRWSYQRRFFFTSFSRRKTWWARKRPPGSDPFFTVSPESKRLPGEGEGGSGEPRRCAGRFTCRSSGTRVREWGWGYRTSLWSWCAVSPLEIWCFAPWDPILWPHFFFSNTHNACRLYRQNWSSDAFILCTVVVRPQDLSFRED